MSDDTKRRLMEEAFGVACEALDNPDYLGLIVRTPEGLSFLTNVDERKSITELTSIIECIRSKHATQSKRREEG